MLKTIFRRSPTNWDKFRDFLRDKRIWNKVRQIDGDTYVHTSLEPAELEEWSDCLSYLKTP